MLSPVFTDVHAGPKAQQAQGYDFDKFLSLDLIRSHTKTDDIPAVTDELLKLYRESALRTAQEYTGWLLLERQVVTEDVHPPIGVNHRFHRNRTFTHHTEYAISDPVVWYYGHRSQPPRQLRVKTGTTKLVLPRDHDDFGLGCCNPSGADAFSRVQYVAGLPCLTDAPPQLKLGTLKYISHVIENPGDIVRVSNEAGGVTSGQLGTNSASNPAWASGAIEIWRTMLGDAV